MRFIPLSIHECESHDQKRQRFSPAKHARPHWFFRSAFALLGCSAGSADRSCKSLRAKSSRAPRSSVHRSLDGYGRTWPRHPCQSPLWCARLPHCFHLRGLWMRTHRTRHRNHRRLLRGMVRSHRKSSSDQFIPFLSRNSARHRIRSVFRPRDRQSNFGAGDHGLGGLCAIGSRTSSQSEGTGIRTRCPFAWRLYFQNYRKAFASEYSSARPDSSHDRDGRRDSCRIHAEFSGARSSRTHSKLGRDAQRCARPPL